MSRVWLVCALAAPLAACNPPAVVPPPVRPVISTVVFAEGADRPELAGVINARVQTDFSFQILGRVISRPVHTGDEVKKGQILAAIDPVALRFALLSANADLATANAQLANAIGVAERQAELLRTNVTTKAQADSADQALATARATAAKAEASLAKAKEQFNYARLTASFDGVVTNTGAEVAQTVSPGQMVVNVADPSQRDAVVDAPESALAAFPLRARVEVRAEIDPHFTLEGVVREIAPQADAVTRTRRIKIALTGSSPAFRLNSTVRVRPLGVSDNFGVRLPASSILKQGGKPFVWIVDPKTLKVSTHPVVLADENANPVTVTTGLDPGTRVVVAGVHSLVEGQSVKLQTRNAP